MRRTLGVVSGIAALAVVTIAWHSRAPTSNPALQGAWTVTSWEVGGETLSSPQPGMIVFTETHYTMMYVNDAEPRPGYEGETMTDAETLAAYGTFTANSGRYEVNGNEITTRAYVAKDPNYMGDWPENANVYTFRLEGETLHLQWPSDWPDQRSATLTKVEGQPAPW
jgi:hypothetical protein